jgi:phosphoglucosamine mutase
MGRLFGTDGIRGVANADLTPLVALALGRAVGERLAGHGRAVVLGQDTRRSGEMFVAALSAGLAGTGTDVTQVGVITTPGLAHLTLGEAYAAGVMVSASHNPADDNGLKVLVNGRKADVALETDLERLMAASGAPAAEPNARIGRISRDRRAAASYREHLATAAGDTLVGLRIGVDCGNGSASELVPDLFGELGAELTVLAADPDGTNINEGCGSTHPERLAATVREERLQMGFAFDGDADRLIAVDERGELVDGDRIMGICALQLQRDGELRNNVVVATVMSNGGLERALAASGISLIRTPVGDRYVLEAMEEQGAVLGGEQSGHVIFRELAATGDGILTAIELVKALRAASDATLGELADQIPVLPQVMLNSAVRRKEVWREDAEFSSAVARAEARLGPAGRILVRPSGTESKIRIMVEGERQDEITEIARELQQLAEARLS